MDLVKIKQRIEEQHKLVVSELGGVQKGYEQGLLFVLGLLEGETKTASVAKTDVVNVDGKATAE